MLRFFGWVFLSFSFIFVLGMVLIKWFNVKVFIRYGGVFGYDFLVNFLIDCVSFVIVLFLFLI